MQRSTLYTIVAGLIALALGAVAGASRSTARISAPEDRTGDVPKTPHHNGTATPMETHQAVPPPRFAPGLAETLEKETGGRRWLLMLSAAEKASAQEMPELIQAAKGDSAMIRMLAARWAELDPVHMFHWLYTEFNTPADAPGALPARWTLADVLFEEWTQRDMRGAIKALNDAPNFGGRENLRMTVANRVLKSDPERGLRAMRDWNIRNYIPDMKPIAAWAASDPQHAAEVVLENGRDYAGREALKEVGKAWGRADPKAAIQFAATISDKSAAATLASEAMARWAEKSPRDAAAFAAAQPDAIFRGSLAQGLLGTWAKSDAAAALAWSEEHLNGAARTEAISGLIKSAAEKNIESAAQLVASLEPGAAQNRACASIFEAWFNKGADQRSAAFDWLAELPDAEARNAALERVQWNWMWREPDAVRDFVSGPHGNLASSSMISQVARGQAAKNPESAMEWASNLPGDRRNTARAAVLQQWLQVRPEGALNYVRDLPAGAERDLAIQNAAQSLMYQAPQQVAGWMKSLPSADQKNLRDMAARYNLPEDKRRLFDAK
jgi:hypothetical protein